MRKQLDDAIQLAKDLQLAIEDINVNIDDNGEISSALDNAGYIVDDLEMALEDVLKLKLN